MEIYDFDDYLVGLPGNDKDKILKCNVENTIQKLTYGKNVAIFDLDHTLIKPKYGKTFYNNKNEWELYNNNVPFLLKKYYNNDYIIIVISNQKNLKNNMAKYNHFKSKIIDFYNLLNIDIILLASLTHNYFRKPMTGFYDKFFPNIIKSDSFFCGDAGGLDTDFSDTDRKFSENIGIRFYHPIEFFKGKNITYNKINYLPFSNYCDPLIDDPHTDLLFIKNSVISYLLNKHKTIIINIGLPGSGKSLFSDNLIDKYKIISQDVYKTKSKVKKEVINEMEKEGNIILDNTNISRKIRSEWIELSIKYNYEIVLLHFDTHIDICKHNNIYRYIKSNYKRKMVPTLVYNKMKKEYNKPTFREYEMFDKNDNYDDTKYGIITIEYVPSISKEDKLYYQYLM